LGLHFLILNSGTGGKFGGEHQGKCPITPCVRLVSAQKKNVSELKRCRCHL